MPYHHRRRRSALLAVLLLVAPWLFAVTGPMYAEPLGPGAHIILAVPHLAGIGGLASLVTLARRWLTAGMAVVTAFGLVSSVAPARGAEHSVASSVSLRVLTVNVLAGLGDAAILARIVAEYDVDLLAVQELTPRFVAEARHAGLLDLLPEAVLYPAGGVLGSGVLARHPLRDDGVRISPGGFQQARAELHLPGGRLVLVESAHPLWTYEPDEGIAEDGAAGGPALDDPAPLVGLPAATPDGPLRLLLGTFSVTMDHRGLRDLISSGYQDAAEVVGATLVGTWGPATAEPGAPIGAAVDHVLADSRIGVRQVLVFELPGTDHRPLLAELLVP